MKWFVSLLIAALAGYLGYMGGYHRGSADGENTRAGRLAYLQEANAELAAEATRATHDLAVLRAERAAPQASDAPAYRARYYGSPGRGYWDIAPDRYPGTSSMSRTGGASTGGLSAEGRAILEKRVFGAASPAP